MALGSRITLANQLACGSFDMCSCQWKATTCYLDPFMEDKWEREDIVLASDRKGQNGTLFLKKGTLVTLFRRRTSHAPQSF